MKTTIELPVSNSTKDKTLKFVVDHTTGEVTLTTPVMWKDAAVRLADLEHVIGRLTAAQQNYEATGTTISSGT